MTNERDKEILAEWFGLIDSPESLEEIDQSRIRRKSVGFSANTTMTSRTSKNG